MSITHRPTHDWIILKIREVTGTMPLVRGIFQPGSPDVKPKKYADVIAVGPGRYSIHTGQTVPLPCQVGDVVMIREVAGEPVVVEGELYHWSIPDEILAVVEQKAGA